VEVSEEGRKGGGGGGGGGGYTRFAAFCMAMSLLHGRGLIILHIRLFLEVVSHASYRRRH